MGSPMKLTSIILATGTFLFVGCGAMRGITKVVDVGGNGVENISRGISVGEKTKIKKFVSVKQLVRGGKGSLQINLDKAPFVTLYASEPNSQGLISFTDLKFLSGNYSGWNEFYLKLNGTGNFKKDVSGNVHFSIETSPAAGNIYRGAIKSNSQRLYNERGLKSIKSRQMRVEELVKWQKTQNPPQFISLDDYIEYWQPIMLPEISRKKNQSADYKEIKSHSGPADYVWGEEVRWNKKYTAAFFPDELHPVRDSGALMRDFEEAAAWFYLLYSWDELLTVK
ncbi:MAG: hypothetical protein Ta2G_13610 [Termitinemataceae bacterium]|nr:MAG: hypothetical protein Ta2G_13610 [Termitinemataceae bacterium]